MSGLAIILAYIGAFAVFWAVPWRYIMRAKPFIGKQLSLRAQYLKELRTNEELIFACRELEWNGGRLSCPIGYARSCRIIQR